eukprot:5500712-Prymnesium_polylepis.1
MRALRDNYCPAEMREPHSCEKSLPGAEPPPERGGIRTERSDLYRSRFKYIYTSARRPAHDCTYGTIPVPKAPLP